MRRILGLPLPPPVEQPPVNVGTPSLSERMMRALELKGLLPNVLRPSLVPVVIAADMTDPQYRWLSRERTYYGSATFAASPGNNQIYDLVFGAATNDQICIVESVRIYNREVTSQLWGIYIASVITGGANSPRRAILDARADGPGNVGAPFDTIPSFPTCTITSFQGVQAIGVNTPLWEIPATSSLEIIGPWILTIGRLGPILKVHSNAVNVASSVIFKWRERLMPTSEAS